jgi:hypothetical protein
MNLNRETKQSLAGFLARLGVDPRDPHGVRVLENGTEEIQHDLSRGRKPKLHNMAGGIARLEENYLYYTRRFPLNTANNTIGSGALAAQDYTYFTNGLGDAGSVAGYFSLTQLTLQQTNMASSGKIPMNRGFRLWDLGVSFNAGIIAADLVQCLDVMNLRFEKPGGSVVVQHGPIKFWPGGTGVYGFAATTATTTTLQGSSSGMPAIANVRRFKQPRDIMPNDSFQYVINAAATMPNVNAAVALSAFVEVTVWMFGQVLDRLTA